jgi:hypothetical protein
MAPGRTAPKAPRAGPKTRKPRISVDPERENEESQDSAAEDFTCLAQKMVASVSMCNTIV